MDETNGTSLLFDTVFVWNFNICKSKGDWWKWCKTADGKMNWTHFQHVFSSRVSEYVIGDSALPSSVSVQNWDQSFTCIFFCAVVRPKSTVYTTIVINIRLHQLSRYQPPPEQVNMSLYRCVQFVIQMSELRTWNDVFSDLNCSICQEGRFDDGDLNVKQLGYISDKCPHIYAPYWGNLQAWTVWLLWLDK